MKQYRALIKHIAYKIVDINCADEKIANDEALFIAQTTDWRNPDWYGVIVDSVMEIDETKGE